MSERPDKLDTLWHPPTNPNEWRSMSTPTRRRRVRLNPTLPSDIPPSPDQTGGWHLPAIQDTTARPAPKAARPEAIALGLIQDEPQTASESPPPDETATAVPLRPEDFAYEEEETAPADPLRPEDAALEEEGARTVPLRPEDAAYQTGADDDYTAALDELDDDEEDAFTMSELLALQSLADAQTSADVQQGESLDMDVTTQDTDSEALNPSSLSPAERAAMGLDKQETTGDTAIPADQFDYASQLAALQGGDASPQQTGAPASSDDPQSYAQQQLAALQGGDASPQQTGAPASGGDPQNYAQQQLAALQGDPYSGADTQTLQDTPAYGGPPPADPEQEAFAQRFQQVEAQIRELRAQRDQGMIDQGQFESALRELMIFDEREGVYWMMGADTEIWYKYDNNTGQWMVAQPPRSAASQQQAAPPSQPYQQSVPTPDTGMREVGDLSASLPQVQQGQQTEWGYSQPGEAQPQFGQESYQMPQAVRPQDEGATVVGDAAFRDQLSSASETVPSMGRVDDDGGYVGIEGAVETAPDYEAEMEDDLSSEIELAKRRRQRQLVTTIAATVGIITGVGLLLAAGVIFYVYSQYQGIKTQWDNQIASFGTFETDFQTVIIQDVRGNEIARLRSQDGGDRTNIALENVSPNMIHAIVSTENERFFNDPGWDPIAITRAFLTNLTAGEVVSGGSTITQQLAENIILRNSDASFTTPAQAKLNEIVVSHELAQRYTKERILEVYLNEIYFGNQKYGVEAAAEFYFDKPAADLNLAEAALLAGLVQAPAANDPVTNPASAFNRLDNVVRLMTQAGNGSGCLPIPFQAQPYCITQQTLEGEAAINIAEVKTTVYLPEETSITYPHFVTFVQQQLQQQFTQEEIFRRGFVVRTTLRTDIQDSAQANLQNYVDSIGTTGVNSGTLMVTNPDTGAILSMIGSPDFNNETIDGQVNLALSWQQPGSAIKPVTYARALEGIVGEGGPAYYTPATILWDVPTTYGDANNTVIQNFDNEYHGPQSVRSALQNSYNVPAVKAYAFIGNENFTQTAQAMGMRFLDEAQFNLTTALGSTEVRLYDMMEAYGTIANDGTLVPLYAIEEITDGAGNPIEWSRGEPSRGLTEQTAFLMQNILSDNQARATEFGPNNRLGFASYPGQVGAKTGTSNDGRDLWTLGFTDDVVVGVWLGNVDNNPTFNTSGYTTASPLWRTVMENVLAATTTPSAWNIPPNIVETQYCATTGTQLDPNGQIPCNNVRTGYFISNQLPPPATQGFITQATINTWTQQLANEFCPNDTAQITVANIDDPTAIAWLRDNPSGQQTAQQLGFPSGVPTAPNAACDANTQLLNANINQPVAGSVVTTPIVQINGMLSSAPTFTSYDIQVAPASAPNQFQIVDGPYNTLPTGQQLGTWDASNVADGQYIIRLAINNSQGGYAYREATITLDKPEPTPTPTPLAIPTAPPIGGNPGGPGGAPTPSPIPFDNGGGNFGSQPTGNPTPTIDFGG